MPEQKESFLERNWEKILTGIAIPLLMWVASNYEERGYMKAKLEGNATIDKLLDDNLDLNDELEKCLNSTE